MTAPDPLTIAPSQADSIARQPAFDWELDECVAKFESAIFSNPAVRLETFAPDSSHPRYLDIVVELMRVDMELAFERGEHRSVDSYVARVPQLKESEQNIEALRVEWKRLQQSLAASASKTPSSKLASLTRFPEAGESLCGFEIGQELGRGAFSRVYLATEPALSSRRIVLKIASQFAYEAEILSRLQHKNIVPIYSVHRHGPYHVVVMPYLGHATLSDVLREMNVSGSWLNSGKALLSTLHQKQLGTVRDQESERSSQSSASGSGSIRTEASNSLHSIQANTDPSLPPSDAVPSGLSMELANSLARYSSADAAVWICMGIAEGLEHAHQRGVLHRDIKPANVLLTEDGLPMLLDFNLATQSDGLGAANLGGTLRYMSPEQLRGTVESRLDVQGAATTSGQAQLDERSDLYSLGVVFYELLYNRPPFEDRKGKWSETLHQMIVDRQSPPMAEVVWERGVTPTLAAIAQKCLQTKPSQRYANVTEFLDDLRCHLGNLPTKHVKTRSVRERLNKWAKRHPRLSSSASIAVIAGVALFVIAIAYNWRSQQVRRLSGLQWLAESDKTSNGVRGLLAGKSLPVQQLQEWTALCTQQIDAQGTNRWLENLPDSARSQGAFNLANLYFYRANGLIRLASHELNSDKSEAFLQQAIGDSKQAMQIAVEPSQRKLATKFHEILQSRVSDRANQSVIVGSQDEALREEIEIAKIAAQREGNHASYWLSLAQLEAESGSLTDAKLHAEIASQLDPKLVWAHFLMAALKMDIGDFASAKDSLDRVLEMHPDLPEALLNRAIASYSLNDLQQCIEDTNRLEQLAAKDFPRLYFIRESAYRKLGKLEDAERDRVHGLKQNPRDALGFVAQGEAFLRSHPPELDEAIRCFRRAVELNPSMRKGHENLAAVFADAGKLNDALLALDELLERFPDYGLGWTSRAVVQARLGNDEFARKDIDKGLSLERSALGCYQAASALAVLGSNNSDRDRILSLLRETARRDENWALMMLQDADLKNFAESPELKQIVQAAQELLRP